MVHFGGDFTDIFNNIDLKCKSGILSSAKVISALKGDEIYKKGYIGILNSGSAVITRISTAGSSVTIRNITAGDIFGAASVFGDWDENFSSIKAQSDCEIYYFSETDFKKIIKSNSDFAINYISFLTDRIRFLNRRLDMFSASSTQNKLYEFLLSLPNNGGVIELKFSMSELASRLKVGRTSLYRDIKSLEESGLIIRKGKKIILK